jgi:hypothetical protein
MCQARGVCLELLRWWNTKYTMEMEGEFTTHLLMTQAAALLKYKWCVQQDNQEGAPGCTLFMLTQQIKNVLSLIHLFEEPNAVLQKWWKASQANLTMSLVSRLKAGAKSESRRGYHHNIMVSITVC